VAANKPSKVAAVAQRGGLLFTHKVRSSSSSSSSSSGSGGGGGDSRGSSSSRTSLIVASRHALKG
jgi:hypothetical protein